MNGGGIQRVVAVVDTQEARALFKGFRPQTADFQQLLAVLELTILVAPGATMFYAIMRVRPATRVSSGTEAVFRSTPTAFTQSSTTASSLRASWVWLTSC